VISNSQGKILDMVRESPGISFLRYIVNPIQYWIQLIEYSLIYPYGYNKPMKFTDLLR